MSIPNPIANGQVPSGTKLQANLTYLEALITGGQAIKRDTFTALRAAAALAPTTPFLCVATAPDNLFMLYWGDVTIGDGGFTTLASGQAIV